MFQTYKRLGARHIRQPYALCSKLGALRGLYVVQAIRIEVVLEEQLYI